MLRSERALHRVWSADRAIERPRAERAPADPDHADGVVAAAHARRILVDIFDYSRLKGQVREAVQSLVALLAKGRERLQGFAARALSLRAGDPITLADDVGQQIRLVELNTHVLILPCGEA